MAPHRPSSAMTTRFTHLDVGCSPGGLRPSTLISLGLIFSSWISRTSGARNVGSTCGAGAPTEIGGATWTSGAAARERPDRAPAVAPFRHARAAAISIAKTSCGSVSFSVGVDCIGGPLLSPMSPASGGEHALRRGKPSAQKALSKPPHGQRGLTKARRSRGEVGATGSSAGTGAQGSAKKSGISGSGAERAGARSTAS